MPQWHILWGHLGFLKSIALTLPEDAHPNYFLDKIRSDDSELGPIIILDTYPCAQPLLVVGSVEGLHQITQEHPLPIYNAKRNFLSPMIKGLRKMVALELPPTAWREFLKPGFSLSHLRTMTNKLVGEVNIFCEILQKHLDDEKMFRMKDLTDNLTIDIIGKIVL